MLVKVDPIDLIVLMNTMFVLGRHVFSLFTCGSGVWHVRSPNEESSLSGFDVSGSGFDASGSGFDVSGSGFNAPTWLFGLHTVVFDWVTVRLCLFTSKSILFIFITSKNTSVAINNIKISLRLLTINTFAIFQPHWIQTDESIVILNFCLRVDTFHVHGKSMSECANKLTQFADEFRFLFFPDNFYWSPIDIAY